MPLPWSDGAGAGCCCAATGAAPVRIAAMVSTNPSLVMEISFRCIRVEKETSPGEKVPTWCEPMSGV